MINASAIHDHKLVLRYFRSLAHRALAPAASAGLFSPQQPQSSHRVFAPRQNLLSLQQPTEHFVIQWEYIKTVKHEIRLSLFHLAAPRSEKNAVCPVRVCLATINPQSPQMGFVCPVKACFPPTSPQSTLSTCTCATYLAPADERFSFEPRSVQAIYIVSALFVVTGYQRPEQPGNILQQRANADLRKTIESALLVVRRNSDASRSMTSVVPHPGACWCKKRFTSRRSLSAYGTGSGSGALSRHLTMSTPLRNTSLSDPNFVERASKGVTA